MPQNTALTSDVDGQFNGTIGEVLLVAPAAAEVVVADLTGGNFADDRVLPPGQLDGQSGDFAAVEFGGPLDRLG